MIKKYKGILKNRKEAAKELLDIIPMQRYKDESWKIVAISPGGLRLAALINSRYHNDYDLLLLEPILAPNNPECELACVSEQEEIVINEDLTRAFEIKYDYIYGEAQRKHEEKILSKIYKYRKGNKFFDVKDDVVLIVDDGSETGLRFMTALKTILSRKPKAVYLAMPVVPSDVLELLEPFADDIYYVYDIVDYVNTSLYYEELEFISDEEIENLLEGNSCEI
jgi:putative phosphoribosyl transferase